MDDLISRVKTLGFEHIEYPDGWFWVLYPDSTEKKLQLSKALGFGNECWDGPPDVVFLQVDDIRSNWQYCFGSEYGSIDKHDVIGVLDALEAEPN